MKILKYVLIATLCVSVPFALKSMGIVKIVLGWNRDNECLQEIVAAMKKALVQDMPSSGICSGFQWSVAPTLKEQGTGFPQRGVEIGIAWKGRWAETARSKFFSYEELLTKESWIEWVEPQITTFFAGRDEARKKEAIAEWRVWQKKHVVTRKEVEEKLRKFKLPSLPEENLPSEVCGCIGGFLEAHEVCQNEKTL
jgi:hypothetical protein